MNFSIIISLPIILASDGNVFPGNSGMLISK